MAHKTERGVFELRQGRAVCVTGPTAEACALVAAVEGLDDDRLEQIRSLGAPVRLVLTSQRGHVLGIPSQNGGGPLSVVLDEDQTPESLLVLAADRTVATSPSRLGLGARHATPLEAAGLALARAGHLLPAVVSVEVQPDAPELARWLADDAVLRVPAAEAVASLADTGIRITEVADAPVPLSVTDHARFVFFRESNGLLEHVAVLIGDRERWPDPVPVRLHSACLTGDLFGSRRCDCGEQLRGSLDHFEKRGGGVLVYLAHEGRGIGLGNKIRAYRLQEDGLDTVDADGVLGFGEDERSYEAAVAILRHLDIGRIELLTNNPHKVRAVEDGGLDVVTRTPLYGEINRHNLRYVQAKVNRSGHWLAEMIAQRASAD